MTQNANARLNGRQLQMLANGLLGAFTSFNDLARVVRVALDVWLHEIVDQKANFTDQVWQLVQWVDAKGKAQDLFREAVWAVPGNVQRRAATEADLSRGNLDDTMPLRALQHRAWWRRTHSGLRWWLLSSPSPR
jgi:hypothetical protein